MQSLTHRTSAARVILTSSLLRGGVAIYSAPGSEGGGMPHIVATVERANRAFGALKRDTTARDRVRSALQSSSTVLDAAERLGMLSELDDRGREDAALLLRAIPAGLQAGLLSVLDSADDQTQSCYVTVVGASNALPSGTPTKESDRGGQSSKSTTTDQPLRHSSAGAPKKPRWMMWASVSSTASSSRIRRRDASA